MYYQRKINCFVLSIGSSSRPKRSIDNPLDILANVKQFVVNSNRLSWKDVFLNSGSNIDYGMKPN